MRENLQLDNEWNPHQLILYPVSFREKKNLYLVSILPNVESISQKSSLYIHYEILILIVNLIIVLIIFIVFWTKKIIFITCYMHDKYRVSSVFLINH